MQSPSQRGTDVLHFQLMPVHPVAVWSSVSHTDHSSSDDREPLDQPHSPDADLLQLWVFGCCVRLFRSRTTCYSLLGTTQALVGPEATPSQHKSLQTSQAKPLGLRLLGNTWNPQAVNHSSRTLQPRPEASISGTGLGEN